VIVGPAQKRIVPQARRSGRELQVWHGEQVLTRPRGPGSHKGMVRIPGGAFTMGSNEFYPEERPVREVTVTGFWMDECPVTVAQFRRFVGETGYVTLAELAPRPEDYPGADPEALVPGALVFTMAPGPVDLNEWRRWWRYAPGADWRRPLGPEAPSGDRQRHPVTQVAYRDALAYADWAGKELPTEAEWEFAARGGLEAAVFAWGDEFMPRGRVMANTWHGAFPWQYAPSSRSRGPGTSPVGSFPANGYGLLDMTGNVWEWTCDAFVAGHAPADQGPQARRTSCCAPDPEAADARSGVVERFPRRVTKGGSYLCAPNYCLRYRPAARQGQTEDTATCHLGFRCILRD
jgi:formylglycine-generating enzyme required for sulfatase activity